MIFPQQFLTAGGALRAHLYAMRENAGQFDVRERDLRRDLATLAANRAALRAAIDQAEAALNALGEPVKIHDDDGNEVFEISATLTVKDRR